jgi:hypothetical protein
MQISWGKPRSLPRTPAGFTALGLDGYGLCDRLPALPPSSASYPVPVCQVAISLHASFRRSLAVPPLRFRLDPLPPLAPSGRFLGHHLASAMRRCSGSVTTPRVRAEVRGRSGSCFRGRWPALASARNSRNWRAVQPWTFRYPEDRWQAGSTGPALLPERDPAASTGPCVATPRRRGH